MHVGTIDPRYCNSFEKYGDKHWVSGGVSVEQIEEVKSSLGARRKTDNKVEKKQ